MNYLPSLRITQYMIKVAFKATVNTIDQNKFSNERSHFGNDKIIFPDQTIKVHQTINHKPFFVSFFIGNLITLVISTFKRFSKVNVHVHLDKSINGSGSGGNTELWISQWVMLTV